MIIIGAAVAIGGIAAVNPEFRANLAANPTVGPIINRAAQSVHTFATPPADAATAAATSAPEQPQTTTPPPTTPSAIPTGKKPENDRGYTPDVVLNGIELINCKPKDTIAIKDAEEQVKHTPRDQIDWAAIRSKVCA